MVPTWSRPTSLARSRGSFVALAGTVAGFAFAGICAVMPVAVAQAATTPASCPASTLSQPFLKWEDANYYSSVPGGGFEAGEAGWALAGGAKTAAGSESFAVTGKLGASSLELPEGASAQSPVMCVEPSDGTFRFFVRREASLATVVAWIVYESSVGSVALPIKTLSAGASWEPSPVLQTGAALASRISGGVAHLSIRFTSTRGTARIDDVYLDPRMR